VCVAFHLPRIGGTFFVYCALAAAAVLWDLIIYVIQDVNANEQSSFFRDVSKAAKCTPRKARRRKMLDLARGVVQGPLFLYYTHTPLFLVYFFK
jgi:hypothetical protein